MQSNAVFGKRNEPHTIIIARGKSVTHFTVRPWVMALCGAVIAAVCVGYLASTSYLIFRDDLLSASMARQARLQHAYEDRISALRAQVDRITSHRLLDQQVMETKLAELMTRQNVLAQRAGLTGDVMERVRREGLSIPSGAPSIDGALPVPGLRPGSSQANAAPFIDADTTPVTASSIAAVSQTDQITTGATPPNTAPGKVQMALNNVTDTLAQIEAGQVKQLHNLRLAADEKAEIIAKTARAAGLSVKAAKSEFSAQGGPLLPARGLDADGRFEVSMEALDASLIALEETRRRVRAYPIANPAPGKSLSSRFGNRRDPITGGRAFHAGLDFRTPTGTPILATADGVVTFAGRKGGYGKMVELRHANGMITRYAHLSRINVKRNQSVSAGQKVGAAGSTGRSTGPHLHYEVRKDGKPLDPMKYLAAGRKLADKL